MKTKKTLTACFIAAVCLFLTTESTAIEARQARSDADLSGEQVLAAYVSALGGEKALASVESLHRKGELIVESPITGLSKGRYEMTLVPRQRVYRASELGAFSTTAAWDGKTGWEEGPRGLRTLTGEELRQLRAEADLFHFTGLWRPREMTVERRDDEPLDGVDHWVVELREKGREPMKAYLDPETGLLAQVVHTVFIPGLGDTVAVSDFWDYREHGVVLMPAAVGFSIEGLFSSEVVFDETVINAPVDETRFAFPR